MDDLTVTTKAVTGARWLLTDLQDIISWERMEFKQTKSRGLVIKNGKVKNKYRFQVADMEILSITKKPVKSLGKVFDSSLSDKDSIKQTTRQFSECLSTIDKSGLPGKFKAWIYQHGLLPRILWPLLVYEFTMTTIEEYERKISGYIRWPGLPSTPRVSSTPHWGTRSKKEKQRLVQDQVRTSAEESRKCKTVSMSLQGRWKRWESVQSRKITWTDLWKLAPHRIKFLVQAVYVLPTPTNLMTWGKAESPNCTLCGKPGNLEHILSSCSKAFADGRYRWHHDTGLREIAYVIDSAMKSKRGAKNKSSKFISFVKAGEKIVKKNHQPVGLLYKATDWKMIVDLEKQLQFPQDIVETRLRPDMVLLSPFTKQLVLIELTVPWEERIEEAHERKRLKCELLVEQCKARDGLQDVTQ